MIFSQSQFFVSLIYFSIDFLLLIINSSSNPYCFFFSLTLGFALIFLVSKGRNLDNLFNLFYIFSFLSNICIQCYKFLFKYFCSSPQILMVWFYFHLVKNFVFLLSVFSHFICMLFWACLICIYLAILHLSFS